MQDYKPNSNRFKTEQKEIEKKEVRKVVKGKATVKKKGGVSKLTDSFISEEASNVGNYIWTELVLPTIKQTLVDAIRNSAEMIFLGKVSSGRGRGSSGGSSNYVSYDRFSRGSSDRSYESSARRLFDPDSIIFEEKVDAEDVLQQMDEMMANYGLVSVSDLYDMAGLSAPHTSNKYGWTNIRNAEVVRGSDGYIIRLPRPKAI